MYHAACFDDVAARTHANNMNNSEVAEKWNKNPSSSLFAVLKERTKTLYIRGKVI
jgi:hypothetical protein